MTFSQDRPTCGKQKIESSPQAVSPEALPALIDEVVVKLENKLFTIGTRLAPAINLRKESIYSNQLEILAIHVLRSFNCGDQEYYHNLRLALKKSFPISIQILNLKEIAALQKFYATLNHMSDFITEYSSPKDILNFKFPETQGYQSLIDPANGIKLDFLLNFINFEPLDNQFDLFIASRAEKIDVLKTKIDEINNHYFYKDISKIAFLIELLKTGIESSAYEIPDWLGDESNINNKFDLVAKVVNHLILNHDINDSNLGLYVDVCKSIYEISESIDSKSAVSFSMAIETAKTLKQLRRKQSNSEILGLINEVLFSLPKYSDDQPEQNPIAGFILRLLDEGLDTEQLETPIGISLKGAPENQADKIIASLTYLLENYDYDHSTWIMLYQYLKIATEKKLLLNISKAQVDLFITSLQSSGKDTKNRFELNIIGNIISELNLIQLTNSACMISAA